MAILSDEAPEQFAVFGRWISNYLAGTTGAKTVTSAIRSAGEIKSMFATKLQQYGERLKEEARQEEKRETARAMTQRGIDVGVIAEVTGLSTEEIEALQIDQFPRTYPPLRGSLRRALASVDSFTGPVIIHRIHNLSGVLDDVHDPIDSRVFRFALTESGPIKLRRAHLYLLIESRRHRRVLRWRRDTRRIALP